MRQGQRRRRAVRNLGNWFTQLARAHKHQMLRQQWPVHDQIIVFFDVRASAVLLGPVPRNVVGATLGLGSSTSVVPSAAHKSLF